MAEIEEVLVENLAGSTTRRAIFDQWTALVAAITEIVPLPEHWIDGSLVTTKIDPNDVDLCSHVDGLRFEALEAADRDRCNALVSGPSALAPRCDSFAISAYPEGHEAHATYVFLAQKFDELFGIGRDGNPKGYVGLCADA